MENYLQESGHAGRDGDNSIAVLYYSKSDFASTRDSSMKKYCENIDQCRRMQLLKEFDCNDTGPLVLPPVPVNVVIFVNYAVLVTCVTASVYRV